MVNRHMKICLKSLIIRGMQIKTAMRKHLMSVRMAIINNSKKNSYRQEGAGKKYAKL